MKKLIAALLLLGAGVSAYAEVAGNIAITTDYRFRGISQTDRDPALQGEQVAQTSIEIIRPQTHTRFTIDEFGEQANIVSLNLYCSCYQTAYLEFAGYRFGRFVGIPVPHR